MMSLSKKYLQSHESSKSLRMSSQNSFSEDNKQDHKPLSNFIPNRILKNTEYLTNLQNYLSINRPYTQVEFDYLYEGIDPGSLCKIIVQNVYLLQICYLFKIKVYLSLNFYTDKGKYIPSTPTLNIFQLYCFQNQLDQKGDMIKQAVLEHKFVKIFEEEKNRIEDFFLALDLLVKHVKSYLRETEKSPKPQNSPSSQIHQKRKYLSQFVKIYSQIIYPQKDRFQQPKTLIKFLEQTKLFRFNALLLKIVNGTLFYSIKLFSKQFLEHLKQSVQQISKYFVYESGQNKHEQPVVKTIDYFFTKLCMLNVIEITKSLKGLNEEQDLFNRETLSLFDYDNFIPTKYPTITATILVPEQKYLVVSPELLQRILQSKPIDGIQIDKEIVLPKNLEIQISYAYVVNEINIKCITDIDVLVDNMDYLNYLIAAFNEGMKSTLVIDTIEKFRRSMTKKIEKVVAFKLMCKAKPNQEPLTKILQLIDVGIIASKIFMAQLSKKSYIKLEDYEKREKLCEMFKHYENIFRTLTRKFYSDIKAGK